MNVTLDDWDKNAKLEAFNWGITNFDTFDQGISCSFYSFLYLLAVVFVNAFILMNVTLTERHRYPERFLASYVCDALDMPFNVVFAVNFVVLHLAYSLRR